MKIIQKNWYLFMVLSICFSQEVLPLTQRYFHTEDMGYDYSRGTYLIVLADASLESLLREEDTGDFIHFKKTQGYNVHIADINDIGVNKDALREYLSLYNAPGCRRLFQRNIFLSFKDRQFSICKKIYNY